MASIGDDNQFKADKAWNKVRRAYLACISWADYNVGRALKALEEGPHADNTIIVLWSDHGYAMGEKKHFRKFAFWEEATRVLAYHSRHTVKRRSAALGREVQQGVSLVNIYKDPHRTLWFTDARPCRWILSQPTTV